MRSLLIGTLAIAASVVGAPLGHAAAPAPVYNWTGYYIGVNGGYGWGNDAGSATVFPSSVPLPPTWVITAPAPGPFDFSIDNPKGGFGGFQVGSLWQMNRVVYGLEADFDFSGIKGNGASSFSFFVNNPDAGLFRGTATLEQKLKWFSTFRGRLGYDFNPILVYVTGGLAIGQIESSLALSGSTFDTGGGTPIFVASTGSSASSSSTRVGFAVGAGVEWMIARNWTARGEYLFMSFDNSSSLAIPGATATNLGMDVSLVRGAINFRFGP